MICPSAASLLFLCDAAGGIQTIGSGELQFPATINNGEGPRVVSAVAEVLQRARAIRVHCVGSDDGVIGGATLNDEAAQIGGIMKLKRAIAVKPHNAGGIERNVCRVVRRIAGS